MDVKIYEFMMGASAFVITVLGFMLATTILPKDGLEKLRKARNILVPSYFVLALLSLVCCFTGYDRCIEPASTLFVASFQALLLPCPCWFSYVRVKSDGVQCSDRPELLRWQVLPCLSPCFVLQIIICGFFIRASLLILFSWLSILENSRWLTTRRYKRWRITMTRTRKVVWHG